MHEPVLVDEVIEYLHIEPEGKYIDATVGAGGHTAQILKRGGIVLGLDQDPNMLEVAQKNLDKLACPNFKLVNDNFVNIAKEAQDNGFDKASGILFDLGVSSLHYQWRERGFSFADSDAPLDMRLSPEMGLTAADLLNSLRIDQLEQLFKPTLTKFAKRLAHRVVDQRRQHKFETVGDFLEVCKILPIRSSKNPATVCFMALRIAVNSEFENIKLALPDAIKLLANKARLAVITFHSSEDALVKKIFLDLESQNQIKILTKKAIEPTGEEVAKNPRARSAKLRVIEKND